MSDIEFLNADKDSGMESIVSSKDETPERKTVSANDHCLVNMINLNFNSVNYRTIHKLTMITKM